MVVFTLRISNESTNIYQLNENFSFWKNKFRLLQHNSFMKGGVSAG